MPESSPPSGLPVEIFAARRERLLELIGSGVAVIPSAPELHSSRDTEVPYRPSSDLYYLTGWMEPGSVAVVTPHDPDHRFTLFVRPRDPEREAWVGARHGVEGAAAFGCDAAYPMEELPTRLPLLMRAADRVHFPIGVVPEIDRLVTDTLVRSRTQRQRTGAGPTGLVDLEASTGKMRIVKDAHELERMAAAARIAAAGHLAAMVRAKPGLGEWEIQAALEGAFRSFGGATPAFPSIVGSGANATVLHYVTNQSRVGENDLILIDAGAEWGLYCSDITRTFPASGRFSGPQRDLYEVVLAAEEAAIAAARPGAAVTDLHDAAVPILARGLVDLGILSGGVEEAIETGAYKRYFLHQTSHWLGLDVHDVGLYRSGTEAVALRPGMVMTVEPGLYIPAGDDGVPEAFRGVGIRIEDDVVVTSHGHDVITRGVPVRVEEIEALMGRE